MPPRVTVVVTQRERKSLTERSLESVLSDRSEPFELIYVDGGSSADLRLYLQMKSEDAQFLLLQQPDWLWPNVARNLAMTHVKTEYVVFIDNDVLVEPGWLQRLVRAADETGGALVGPLYLWSDGVDQPRIHMAGGVLQFEETADGLEIFERHNHINERLEFRSRLVRGPCDYLEYHCMLVRTDFLKAIGGLDEQITCVHEHIDLALEARKRNLPIVMEPTAGVDYLAFIPLALSDVAFYQWRWSQEAVTSSLGAFCRKWKSNENGSSLKDVRKFAITHRDAAGLFATGLQGFTNETPLTNHDVRQTLFELMKQAFVRGYSREDVSLIGKAYNVAMTLFGDGFRPCGRPFLLHLVGTASVLVAYGLAARVVVCGMLHAAYSHAPVGQLKSASQDAVKRMLQSSFEDRIELTIREYTRFRLDPAGWCNQRPGGPRTLDDVAVIAMALANSIDEHFAGEYLFTHKRESKCEWRDYAFQTANALNLPGLALSLSAASSASVPEGFHVRAKFNRSFRIQKGDAVPMEHGGFGTWDTERHSSTGGGSSAFSLTG